MYFIPPIPDCIQNVFPIFVELGIKETTNIFKHDCTGTNFTNKPYCFGEQVSFIVLAQLLRCLRKWGARHTTCQQVYSLIWGAIKVMDIGTNHIPMGLIIFKCCTVISLIFNQCQVFKACHIKAQSLSTSTSANFNTGKQRSTPF